MPLPISRATAALLDTLLLPPDLGPLTAAPPPPPSTPSPSPTPSPPHIFYTDTSVLAIKSIDVVATTTGNGNFNAPAALAALRGESWTTIGIKARNTRDKLLAAADAFLDALGGGTNATVPWAAVGCGRLDGGVYVTAGECGDLKGAGGRGGP
ncbi:hypothetical protein B0T25DRAFT_618287 [Lasiosphaeria hispida]|uniref:DUF8021 domain-containing protein n=1 Tax=Lasiosphaeria hispida TaxID=260671 RepID=A0AAJ0H520_9PEZI|nr:hypothetical protein B0T25DRAFT_618287 [Lasiosphaeria hispida]